MFTYMYMYKYSICTCTCMTINKQQHYITCHTCTVPDFINFTYYDRSYTLIR